MGKGLFGAPGTAGPACNDIPLQADRKSIQERTLTSNTALNAVPSRSGTVRRTAGAASRAGLLITSLRGFLEGASKAALSTNAWVAHGFGLVPKAAAIQR